MTVRGGFPEEYVATDISSVVGPCIDTNLGISYYRDMKNITITVPEDLALWLRVRAAKQNLSMSRWLAGVLADMRRREDAYEVSMKRFLARKPRHLEWIGGRKPSREELHDRASLR